MFSAIVYKSTTGSCKRYAELLSARLHIPAFPLGKEYIPADTKIIFVGWLFATRKTWFVTARSLPSFRSA